ncbi:type II secretion system protein N [Achromobacter xylosoxidans]
MTLNLRVAPSHVASLAAAAALAAGLAWWGWRLSQPVTPPPIVAAPAVAVTEDGAAEVAAWMAPGPARLDVQVAGVLAGAGRGAAVLSVNGGPAQAYAIGERLTRSARLVAIDAHGLVVEHGGREVRLPLPVLAGDDGEGIRRVPMP